jgi:ATP-binding cassette subfamily F protein uup
MSLLSLRGVTQRLHERVLLDGVDLLIGEDTRLALIGANGSGKTTLLRILTGELTPDGGERQLRRGLKIGVLDQTPKLPVATTVRGAVRAGFEHVADEVHDHAVDHELARFGLDEPERDPALLSEGELRRAALARLFLSAPDVFLLDEPTNQLDVFATDVLEDRLLALRTPFVLVTHDRYFLDRVVTNIAELERGTLHLHDGTYGDYLSARAERLGLEERVSSERQALLLRETIWMRRGAPARTTKSKARIARYEELTDATAKTRGRELELELPPGPRLGSRVLTLKGVAKEIGGRTLLRALDLELAAGERIGIVGANGAGKSLLLALCAGDVAPDRGTREVGETVKFARLDAQRPGLNPANTVVEELAGRSEQITIGDRVLRAESFLERFLFPGAMKHTLVGALSGGERLRVLLAKLLIAGGNVLLLDEPTQDLDLATLRALEEALLAFPGSALLVSHDRWFLDRIATRILYLDGTGGARLHYGDLSSLLEALARERAAALAAKAGPAKKAAPPKEDATPKRAKGLSSWEQRELDELLAKIPKEEARVAEFDAKLADPTLYTARRAELPAIQSGRATLASALETLYARWQELEEKRG